MYFYLLAACFPKYLTYTDSLITDYEDFFIGENHAQDTKIIYHYAYSRNEYIFC